MDGASENRRLDPAHLQHAGADLAAGLPPLLVEAERLAMAIAPGVHGRRRSGPGETFWQYRRYSPGDASTAIDWRQSARTDHLYVRENEWEAAHSVLLWRDASASMTYASAQAPCAKDHRAGVLILALAALLVRGGERVGPLEGHIRPASGPGALRRLADHVSLAGEKDASRIPESARLPRASRIILASDFLMDPDHLAGRLRLYATHGVTGHLLMVLDPAEEDLPFSGRVLFRDMETSESFLAGRAETLRDEYRVRLDRHRNLIAGIAHRWGWTLTHHRTDEAPQVPLLALYNLISGASVPW